MYTGLAEWSVMLLCLSMTLAIGGGLYEHLVLTPLWSASPPSSFAIIQPGTGVPLQKFWIPVHTAITIFLMLSLCYRWSWRGGRWRCAASCSSDSARISSCVCGVVSISSARCWRFKKSLLTLLHRQNCPRESRAGRFGRGSENLSTSSHLSVFC